MSEFNENNQENITEVNSAENPVEQTAEILDNQPQPAMEGAEIVSGVDIAKKSPAKVIIAIVTAIILLFAAAGASYALIPQVKNTVKMLVNSPAEYYRWVESENTEYFTELLDKAEEEAKANTENSKKLSLKTNLDLASIGEIMGTQLTDEEKAEIPEFSMTVDEKAMMMDDYYAVNGKASLNDVELFTINAYSKDGKVYYQIPEFTSSYLCFDPQDIIDKALAEEDFESDVSDDSDLAPQITNTYMNMMLNMLNGEETLSNEDVKTLIETYSDILFENIENVKLEKNAECEAGGVKSEYTKLTAEIDEGTLFSFLKDALKELKNDKIVIDFVEENLDMTKEEYLEYIDEAIEKTDKYEISGGDSLFTMNVYVNSKGEIVGRTFDDSEISFGYTTANSGADYGVNAFVENNSDDESERYFIDGKFTENKGTYTGDVNVSDAFALSVKDFVINDDAVKGDVTLGFSSLGVGLEDMTLSFDEKDGKQLFNTDLTYEGKKIVDLAIESSNETPESITVFADNAKVYGIDEMEQYLQECDMESYVRKFCEAIGIDDASEVDQMVNNFSQIFSGGYGNIVDDFEVPDDEDYDDDWDSFDDDPYATNNVTYDLSTVKIQLDGKDIKLPGKIAGLTDKVSFDKETVDAGGYDYGFNDDFNITVSVHNDSDKAAAHNDCEVYSISVQEDADMKLSVDGFTFGDDIQKVAQKYGCELEDKNNGYMDVYGTDDYDYITFYYQNGKINEIDVSF